MNESRLTAIILITLSTLSSIAGCGGPSPDLPPEGFKSVPFSNGMVAFAVPEDYVQSTDPDDTIVMRPADESAGITLRFNLHYHEGGNISDDVGVQFVRAQATKKGVELKHVGDKIVITEFGSHEQDGKTYDMIYWQIGVHNAVVVMSAEIDPAKKESQAVIDCMNALPDIVKSMAKQ